MTFLQQIGAYMVRLMSGDTLEIVLLIFLVIVALIILILLVWVAWKLLVLAGKGLLWLFRFGGGKWNERRAVKEGERLAAPPEVATSWSTSPRTRLRRALSEARNIAGPDAYWVLIVSGEKTGGLFRSLGLAPPGLGKVGIAASGDIVLIDASKCDSALLRRLARALPWRRPVDALAAIVDSAGIPDETLQRAATLSRNTDMRLALHLAFPGAGGAAWTIIDGQSGEDACGSLAIKAVRIWLTDGNRDGLHELALAQSGDLPQAINRAQALAPSSIDIASLTLGSGLRQAVAQTTERTRPVETGGFVTGMGIGTLAASLVITIAAVIVGVDRAATLDTAVDAAEREASSLWVADGVETIPSAGRVRRMAGLALRLVDSSGFSPMLPLAPLAPNASAPQRLGAVFLENYMLVPLADALHRQAEERLAPHDDPGRWMDEAQTVSEWLAAWEALGEDPEEVDIRRLLADTFGGDESAWAEGSDLAMVRAGTALPTVARGGLDRDRLLDTARANFVLTMQEWGHSVYTNGPVASAARRAIDRSADWRRQHAALTDLRDALLDPSQQWLTSAEDEPDYAFELRILGRAVALPLLGQAVALEARAAVREIRLDARQNVEYFILPQVGPIMVRTSSGTQNAGPGPSLALAPGAQAWLSFLDRLANAGFAEPSPALGYSVPFGPVTLDQGAVVEVRNRLRVFDAFAAGLAGRPAGRRRPGAHQPDRQRADRGHRHRHRTVPAEPAAHRGSERAGPAAGGRGPDVRRSAGDRGLAAGTRGHRRGQPGPGRARARRGHHPGRGGRSAGGGGSPGHVPRPVRRRRSPRTPLRAGCGAPAPHPRGVRRTVPGGRRGRRTGRRGLAGHHRGHRRLRPGRRRRRAVGPRGPGARLRRGRPGGLRGGAAADSRRPKRLSRARLLPLPHRGR